MDRVNIGVIEERMIHECEVCALGDHHTTQCFLY